MVEYIRRDLVMQKGADVPGFFSKMISSYYVMEIPVEDVEPVKHGKWKADKFKNLWCSVCKHCGSNDGIDTDYCPNCGAKMDLED